MALALLLSGERFFVFVVSRHAQESFASSDNGAVAAAAATLHTRVASCREQAPTTKNRFGSISIGPHSIGIDWRGVALARVSRRSSRARPLQLSGLPRVVRTAAAMSQLSTAVAAKTSRVRGWMEQAGRAGLKGTHQSPTFLFLLHCRAHDYSWVRGAKTPFRLHRTICFWLGTWCSKFVCVALSPGRPADRGVCFFPVAFVAILPQAGRQPLIRNLSLSLSLSRSLPRTCERVFTRTNRKVEHTGGRRTRRNRYSRAVPSEHCAAHAKMFVRLRKVGPLARNKRSLRKLLLVCVLEPVCQPRCSCFILCARAVSCRQNCSQNGACPLGKWFVRANNISRGKASRLHVAPALNLVAGYRS